MTDKEKIRAEIERLKRKYKNESVFRTVRGDTADEVLCKLLSFVDSLTDPIDNDLDKASWEYSDREGISYAQRYAMQIDFKAGANWKEQQLKEDALDCSIIYHPNDSFANYSISAYVPPLHKASSYISNGDKLKIIIIKEDEK
jgi:hypothetical protein